MVIEKPNRGLFVAILRFCRLLYYQSHRLLWSNGWSNPNVTVTYHALNIDVSRVEILTFKRKSMRDLWDATSGFLELKTRIGIFDSNLSGLNKRVHPYIN